MKKSGKIITGITAVSLIAGMCVIPAIAPEMPVTAYADEQSAWVVAPTIEADDIIVVDTDESYVNQTVVDKICAGFDLGDHSYDAYTSVVFKIGGTVGIMDYSGEILETNEKHNAFTTYDGKIGVRFFYQSGWPGDPEYYYTYDEDKNVIKDMFGSYSGDKAVLVSKHDSQWNWYYGIFKENQFIEPMNYENGKMNYVSNNEIIALCKDGKWGYFDGSGEQIIDFICDSVTYVPNSALGLVVTGLSADEAGTNITEDTYYNETVGIFMGSEGYIPVKIDGECAYYNYAGEEVIPTGTFEEVRPVHNGLAWVKYEGKWGVIDVEKAIDGVSISTTTTSTTTTTTTTTSTTETATMPTTTTTTVTVATSGGNLAGGGTGTALPNGTATAIGTGIINTTTATRVYPSGTTTAINSSGNSSTTTALSGNAENSGTTVSGSSQPENNSNNNSSNSNSNSNSSSSDSTGKSSPKTSDAGVGIAVTGIAVATGMAFVARKKKD